MAVCRFFAQKCRWTDIWADIWADKIGGNVCVNHIRNAHFFASKPQFLGGKWGYNAPINAVYKIINLKKISYLFVKVKQKRYFCGDFSTSFHSVRR